MLCAGQSREELIPVLFPVSASEFRPEDNPVSLSCCYGREVIYIPLFPGADFID